MSVKLSWKEYRVINWKDRTGFKQMYTVVLNNCTFGTRLSLQVVRDAALAVSGLAISSAISSSSALRK